MSNIPSAPEDPSRILLAEEKPWWRQRRVIAVAVATVAIIGIVWSMDDDSSAQHYVTQAVGRGDLTVRVSATGNLQPRCGIR
jgi:hypothetical protein